MKQFSRKIHLSLTMPLEDQNISDQQRVLLALETLGYEKVTIPLPVLRSLYPMCRKAGFDITVTLVRRYTDWVMVRAEPGDTTAHHYGLAVDYGSTTIVMRLVNMNSGVTVGEEKLVSGQVAFGTDILTRITFTMENPAHVDALQQATVATFQQLLERLTESTGIDADKCPVMIISGNTTMIHFLLKLDAWTVFAAPYAPVTTDPGFFWGRELDMDFDGLVYIIPSASNYVGGDIVSGLLHLDIHNKEEISLFFDIGTNGELVAGNRDWLIAGAGAAGPALEGYISRFGMRAAPGAIDRVFIQEGELRYTVLGGSKALGICGSGIIDLVAQMRLNGWINVAGELNTHASSRIVWLPEAEDYGVIYATSGESQTGQPLYFTQTDIYKYLETKAAAYTMIDCLLEAAGITTQEISRCCLSGAFPAHSDLESAITIGMFPDLPRDRYCCVANTSLEGATLLLLNKVLPEQAQELAEKIFCVQFASFPDFLVRMQAARFVPHTHMHLFPSIAKNLEKFAETGK